MIAKIFVQFGSTTISSTESPVISRMPVQVKLWTNHASRLRFAT